MPVSVGELFAGFTILRVLGAGGMGTVYLAAHPRLPRQDALKVLPAEWTADPEYRARFLREAELTASLSHPNILGVHDRGEYDGQLWISMDYVGGTDASRLVREQHPTGLPADQARGDHHRGRLGAGLRASTGAAASRRQTGQHPAGSAMRNGFSWPTSVLRG